METFKITCPQCRCVLEADETLRGMTLPCPKCKTELSIDLNNANKTNIEPEIDETTVAAENANKQTAAADKLLQPSTECLAHALDTAPPVAANEIGSLPNRWKRLFARCIDFWLPLIIFVDCFALIFPSTYNYLWATKGLRYTLWSVMCCAAAVIIESGCYAIFRWTLGKALLGIRVINRNGEVLSRKEYFVRCRDFFIRALGCGIPIVCLIVWKEWDRVEKQQRTRYDEINEFHVISVKRHPLLNGLFTMIGVIVFAAVAGLQLWSQFEGKRIDSLVVSGGYTPEEKYELACRLIEGLEVEKDPRKGFSLMLKAADEGYNKARLSAGICYLEGIGTEKNIPAGIKYLTDAATQAADNEEKQAYLVLSNIYLGNFGEQYIDREKAFQYSKLASDANFAAGNFNLGICYFYGVGCVRDEDKALILLKLAAQKGEVVAQQFLQKNNISW